MDSPPTAKTTTTIAGPAFAPYELAVRKTLTLFGRAEPRDFTDVYALHQQFDRADILRDEDFPETTATVEELRAYFDAWADQLAQTSE